MMIRGYDDFVALSKGNVDALIESGTLAATGFEKLAREYVEYATRSVDNASTALTEIGGCTTPAQFVQVQTRLMGEAADNLFVEARKLAEMTGTVVTASLEPLSARLEAALNAKA